MGASLGHRLYLTLGESGRYWPVETPQELKALTATAQMLGVNIQYASEEAARSSLRIERRPELVVAVGTATTPAGELYAALTNRTFASIPSLRQLDSVERAAVVVCSLHELSIADLSRCYEYAGSDQALGIIAGRSLPELRQQVLFRAAAAVCPPQPMTVGTVSLPGVPFQHERLGDLDLLGAHPEPGALRRFFTRRQALLALLSHSDGTDVQLGSGKVLCPFAGTRQPPRPIGLGGGSPRCLLTGECYRTHQPLGSIVGSPSLVNPDELRASLGLFLACFVATGRGSRIRIKRSLLERLVQNPNLGAFYAPWDLVVAGVPDLFRFVNEVLTGTSFGRVVARFHDSDASRVGHLRGCLFGDPDARAVTSTTRLSSPKAEHWRGGFFEGMLRAATADAAIVRKAAAYDRATEGGTAAPDSSSVSADARAILAAIAATGTTPAHNWLHMQTRYQLIARRVRCLSCRRDTRTLEYSLSANVSWKRYLTFCDRCGPVEDYQSGSGLQLEHMKVRDGRLSVAMATSKPIDALALTSSESGRNTVHVFDNVHELAKVNISLNASYVGVYAVAGGEFASFRRVLSNRYIASQVLLPGQLPLLRD